MIVEEYHSTTDIPHKDKHGVKIEKGDIVLMDGHTLIYEVEDFLDDGDIHLISRDGKLHIKADPTCLEVNNFIREREKSSCVHGEGLGFTCKRNVRKHDFSGKRPVKDMNDEIIKLGNIVRIHDGEERYKVTEINPKEMLVRLSSMDGEDKGMYGCGVVAKVKDLDEPMSKSDVPSYDGFSLAVGDTVKIHGDASGGIYYITELKLVDREWYAKLSDKDENPSFFLKASDLELFAGYVLKVGDYVKYHKANDTVYRVLEVMSKDQVKVYRVNDGKVMDIFSVELEKASPRELMRAHGEYIKSVRDMELARYQDAGCGKDGSGKDDRADVKADPMSLESHCVHKAGLEVTRDKNGKILHIGDKVRIKGWNNRVYTITSILDDNLRVIVHSDNGENKGRFWTNEVELVEREEVKSVERENDCEKKIGKDGSGKDDRADGKPRWELIPLDAVEEIVKVYTMGAEKYAPNAWKDIPDAYDRYKAALLRHITAYDKGERLDKESGLSHLAHAAWNAIAILWLDMHKLELNGDNV